MFDPVIEGVGFETIETLYGIVATEQPACVSVNVNVPAPAGPQVTTTEFVPAPDVMAPPEMTHE